jgi:NTP pyrophosphatase (non-canonical NTP hydrolase)
MRTYNLTIGTPIDDMITTPKTRKIVEDLVHELGDVLWYLAMSSAELGVPLNDIAKANIHKLSQRVKNNTIEGSGDDRG